MRKRSRVGSQLHRRRAPLLGLLALLQGTQDADHLVGLGVLEAHHLQLLRALPVDAPDDALHAVHVGEAVGDDQHVGGGIGGEVALLGHQGPQDGDQLGHGHVVHLNHPGDQLVHRVALHPGPFLAELLGIDVRDDLSDLAAGHGAEAVHLQNGQEHPVELLGLHGALGDHRHPRPHPGIHHEVAAGDVGHGVDQGRDVGLFQVEGDARLLLGLGTRGAGQQGEGQHGPGRAHRHESLPPH